MNIIKKLYFCLALLGFLLPIEAFAQQILDKIEIVQTQTEADIHIEFFTQVRYLRHSPNKESSRLQVFLEFPQLGAVTTQRESLNSPPSDIVPSFIVSYPDQNDSLAIRFKKPVKFRITPDNSGRGIVIHVPLDKSAVPQIPELAPAVAAPVTAPTVSAVEIPAIPEGMAVNDYAGKLVAESRVATGLGDYAKAIQLLNAALNFPPHAYSQEAQELIGVAREKNGEFVKAKAEYDLYLKLYPEGDGAKRVRQHLASVEAATKVSSAAALKGRKPIREISETTVYGSWDQYYYDAHTHTYNPDATTNSHSHDQSTLMSSINLTARSRQNQYDSKVVFRNRQTMNFLPNGADRDRTDAAYVEVANSEADYLVRLGRQSGNSGGVLGRFDGALLRYGITPKYRINLVTGSLDEYKVDYKRHFYGINLDIGPINENWSGNAFFVNQEVNGITDRRAVGGELRYFENNRSVYSLIDYDTLFDKLNIAMVQANLQTEGGTNYNMLFDRRKSPILQMISSLSSPILGALVPPPTNIRQALLAGQTESTLRALADSQTLDTDLFLFGATRQVTQRWQLGGDVQMTRVTGGDPTAAIAAARKALLDNNPFIDPLTLQNLNNSFAGGNTWTYHVQAVGLDTIFKDDTSVISASYTAGPTSSMRSLVLTNVMVPREKWRLDSSLKLMKIDTDPSIIQYVVSPTMRASYRLRDKATLEAEIGLEVNNQNDALTGHTRTFRDFSFIGYRIDI
ncbi:MAG: hypothetical protein V4445_07550 [Pseudomonadota bacterium]